MTRTQHWLIAIITTAMLLTLGIVISLNQQKKPQLQGVQAQTPTSLNLDAQDSGLKTVALTVQPNATLSEATALQKTQQLLPMDTIEQGIGQDNAVQKVNYEGKLAYQVTTRQHSVFLNAHTGDVLAITPNVNRPETVQVSYQPNTNAENFAYERGEHKYSEREHDEGEHGEHDDD